MLFEKPAEIQRIVISNDGRNLRYIIVRRLQQAYSVVHTQSQKILGRGLADKLFEVA